MSYKISADKYAMMYGPTTGDKVRLADTSQPMVMSQSLVAERHCAMVWDSP